MHKDENSFKLWQAKLCTCSFQNKFDQALASFCSSSRDNQGPTGQGSHEPTNGPYQSLVFCFLLPYIKKYDKIENQIACSSVSNIKKNA